MEAGKDFFISYHDVDSAWAQWVAWQLEQAGYTTTIQAWDFRPGSNAIVEMQKAIKSARRIVAILSPRYLKAAQSEWTPAFKQDPTGEKGMLLPVRIDQCEPDGLLGSLVAIDLVGKDEDSARAELLAGVVKGRNKPGVPPIFPGQTYGSAAKKPAFPGEHSNVRTSVQAYQSPATKLGDRLLTYDIHSQWIGSVSWSPDGTRIASCGGDGTVRIWDPRTGHTFITYKGHVGWFISNVWQARWSPDGQYIASSGHGSTVHIWNAHTGENLLLYHDNTFIDPLLDTLALAWSPNGEHIASACSFKYTDQTIHIWNPLTGQTVWKYQGHSGFLLAGFSVTAIEWSPDGRCIASSGSDKKIKKIKLDPTEANKSIHIWNPQTGRHILTCGEDTGWIHDIAWSSDNRYIASAATNKAVTIWDAKTGDRVFSYNGHTKEVRSLAWSPDGSRLASAGNDHTVHLWKASTGRLLCVYRGHTDNVATLAWSPDGSCIASAGTDRTVQIWRAV
jgi:Tol biopolymer transport system component